ncbi:MAG: hypothetical protein KAQ64_04430 [Candidatus Pacebacteria bacterium]|nr:hypothetical protein [Candidatus Paceibacterota bacterium]
MTNEKLSSSIPKLIISVTLIVMIGGLMGTVGYLITKKDDLKNISTETEQTKNISIYDIGFEKIFLKDSELKDFYKPYRETNTASGIGKGHPIIFGDLTQDGIDEAVVPVSSGGTAGDTAYAVFSVQNNKLTKLFYNLNIYQVILKIEDGQLIEQTPFFSENDANCCPSFYRYTYYKYNKENNKMEIAKAILKKNDNNLAANEDKNEVDISDWQIYKNEVLELEIKHPINLNKYINEFTFFITSEEDLRKYQKKEEADMCLHNCGLFKENEDLFNKQFEIINKSSHCPYLETYKEDIKNNFVLFSKGIRTIEKIDSIENENLNVCGLKLITYEGYEAGNITLYSYITIFQKDDKIIKIDLPLFPVEVFKEADEIWKEIGYNFETKRCEGCYQNELNFDMNFDVNEKRIQKIIRQYDEIVSSFKLN